MPDETLHNVDAANIANGEYKDWPPWVMGLSAPRDAIAS
jgi:hypothetical protein